MKRTLLVILCIIVVCSLLAVPLLLQPAPTPSALQQAISKAIDFESHEPGDPYALLWHDVMHRRFGIAEFADALQRYDEMMAKDTDRAPVLRVFRRIADHDNPLQDGDLDAVWHEGDRLTAAALYCDRIALPEDYPVMLQQAANLGDYMLPHVLLAWIWIQENGCEVSLPDGFVENLCVANAALIGTDPVVNDLELEAAAFLCLAGQGALVDDAFVERVIEVQNADGGWLFSSDTPGVSDWHTTILGLLLLLHVEYPADSYPPVLAPASP